MESPFESLPSDFREWFVRLSDDLERISNQVKETYPCAGIALRSYGRQADEWVEDLSRAVSSKMPCFCGTQDAYRCPSHINPVQSTSGGR